MTPDPILRSAGPWAAGVIAELHGECFDEEPWSETAVAEILAMPGAFGTLLLLGEEPVGFFLARVAADECELLSLAVRPAWRRLGLGRRLLRAALTQAAASKARVVHLEVSEANLPGLGLYESEKFQNTGRRPGYYAAAGDAGTAALLLSFPLSSP